MGYHVRKCTSSVQVARLRRHKRVRKYVFGTPEKPRLVVFRSQKHIYAQLIDDMNRCTLLQSSTIDKSLKLKKTANIKAAEQVGVDIAKKAIAQKIKKIVFDVAGYKYHGRVKALADAVRKGGLLF